MSELKNKTAKGLAWGGFFSFLQQLLGFAFGIVIARLLTPADFGMVGVLTIFVSLGGLLIESGFIFVLANREGDNKREYSTTLWFNVLISLAIYLLLFVLAPQIASFFGKDELINLSRYVFLGIIFSSMGIVQSAYMFKKMMVKENGMAQAISIIVSGTIGIIMALSGYGYWGIATQGLVASMLRTIMLWYYSPFRPKFCFDLIFLKETLPDGIRFAVPNLFGNISENVYSILLGKLYTVEDVGYFCEANKFCIYGSATISSMLRNVSQPMLVQIRDKNAKLKAFRKLLRLTCMLGFPSLLCLSFIAPELIFVLLGTKWMGSIDIMRILCIAGPFGVLCTLFSYYVVSEGKSKMYMWIGIINSSSSILVAIFASLGGVLWLAAAGVFVAIFLFGIYFYVTKEMTGYTLRMILNDMLPVIMITLVSIMITQLVINYAYLSVMPALFVKVLLTFTIICVGMYFIHYDVFIETLGVVKSKFFKRNKLLR